MCIPLNSSVQFRHAVVSDSLWPHRLQHTRLPYSSPTPRVCSNSSPLSWWPFLLLPSVFPSIRVFSKESVLCLKWPKNWSFSFRISPSYEYSEFRIDWLVLLAVQGTVKSLLQHHSMKAPVLWCSGFFMVELSHPYMTSGKTTTLTIWTFVGKVMTMFLHMLFVIAFLPRSKYL